MVDKGRSFQRGVAGSDPATTHRQIVPLTRTTPEHGRLFRRGVAESPSGEPEHVYRISLGRAMRGSSDRTRTSHKTWIASVPSKGE